MKTLRHISAIAAAGFLATGAFAQDPQIEAPLLGGAPETAEDAGDAAIGEGYILEVFDAWTVRCFRTADGSDPCHMFQLLADDEGTPIAEISIIDLVDMGEFVAAANIVTPLETLLTENVIMRVDQNEPRVYAFTWCEAIGCVAEVGFTEAEIGEFRRGINAVLTIVPAAAPDQQVNITASLLGFTAAYDTVREANEGI